MRLPFLLAFLLIGSYSSGQVRDIQSNIEQDKENSEKSEFREYYHQSSGPGWEPPSLSEGLGEYIAANLTYYTFYGVYKGFEYGQAFMRYRRDEHPETFSFQADLTSGFNTGDDNTLMLSPSLRANRGLFASDIRYLYTDDVTGALKSLDWQVFKLRFPISNFKIEYGIGFSHVFSPSKTYFEQTAGFNWCFFDRKITLEGQYRWSQTTSNGERYRQEGNISIDHEVTRIGNFRIAPLIGFTYQDYFNSTQFRFVRIGLRFRIF